MWGGRRAVERTASRDALSKVRGAADVRDWRHEGAAQPTQRQRCRNVASYASVLLCLCVLSLQPFYCK